MRPLIGICSNYNLENEEYCLRNYYVESVLGGSKCNTITTS